MHQLIFVRVGPSGFAADPRYFGMNSESLPYPSVFSADVERRISELEAHSKGKLRDAEVLLHTLENQADFPVAMLLTCDPGRPNWTFIGFDVGERSDTHWSAIRWMGDFWFNGEADAWITQFNVNGLIPDLPMAEAFLEAYLRSEDSVLTGNRDEDLALYGIFPIWRFIPPYNWAKDARVIGLLQQLQIENGLRVVRQDFPSGFAMVDVFVGDVMLVLQLGPGELALSTIFPEDADFGPLPDERFADFEDLTTRLRALMDRFGEGK